VPSQFFNPQLKLIKKLFANSPVKDYKRLLFTGQGRAEFFQVKTLTAATTVSICVTPPQVLISVYQGLVTLCPETDFEILARNSNILK